MLSLSSSPSPPFYFLPKTCKKTKRICVIRDVIKWLYVLVSPHDTRDYRGVEAPVGGLSSWPHDSTSQTWSLGPGQSSMALPVKIASYFGVPEPMKSQTPSTKLQTNLKFQYQMTKTGLEFWNWGPTRKVGSPSEARTILVIVICLIFVISNF